MNKLTILPIEQLCGKSQLSILKKRGTEAKLTDFSILLGAFVCDVFLDTNTYDVTYTDSVNENLEDRTCWYWSSTIDKNNNVCTISFVGNSNNHLGDEREGGIRPALFYSSLSDIIANGTSKRCSDDILEIEFGYYPRQAASKKLQEQLEEGFQNQEIKTTGNTYTIDSRRGLEFNKNFSPKVLDEYEYNGKKYVRVMANSCFYGRKFRLSNEETYQNGDYVWVEVQPVKWLVDEKEQVILTEEIISSGIQYNHNKKRMNDFDLTDLKLYLDLYLFRDLFQTIIFDLNKTNIDKSTIKYSDRQSNDSTFNNFISKKLRKVKSKN